MSSDSSNKEHFEKHSIIDQISVTGARQHNLQDIDVDIPKHQLVVFTGLSGSGKSSLAFDTLYAEGQRRYVESLSSYARQFLGIMDKPDVDHITGLSPAISIDQKTTSSNPRSTVGTITEIYDYFRLLYARVGHPHCPECGKEIATQSIDQIVDQCFEEMEQRAAAESRPVRVMLLAPVVRDRRGEFSGLFDNLQQKGYSRLRIDGEYHRTDEDLALLKNNRHSIEAIVDRLSISQQQLRDDKERATLRSRVAQSLEETLALADGFAITSFIQDDALHFPESPENVSDTLYSENFACSSCGISLEDLEPRLFSFNSPHGACETCNGIGTILRIDADKIIAPALTLSEGAIIPFASKLSKDTWWSRSVQQVAAEHGIDYREDNWRDLSEEQQETLLHGTGERAYRVRGTNRDGKMTTITEDWSGFIAELETQYEETNSDYIRNEIEQYMNRQTCESCGGARLKDEALSVHIDGVNIAEVTSLAIDQTLEWVQHIQDQDILSKQETIIAEAILKEINSRLSFLTAVGLKYLSLDREAGTLAGGEAQRIRLASQIGTGLTGVLYILDEPTIGLHQRDNHRLIDTLQNLRDKGNSVIVVEHDRDLMLAADEIIDFGPGAGKHGGRVISQGSPEAIMQDKNSITGKYLKRSKDVLRTNAPRLSEEERTLVGPDDVAGRVQDRPQIQLVGAYEHNLKHIDVEFPLHTLTAITGLSGSGKSTLLYDTLYQHLLEKIDRKTDKKPGPIERVTIPDEVRRVTLIDQTPIGKTPRSNPATYTKIFDYIRKIFANTREAQMRGYSPGRFSFNVKGGRCENCSGDGQIKIEMQFLADVYVKCDVCNGKRYNRETLEVRYHDKNIADILSMNVEEAYDFFQSHSTLRKKLKTMLDVGLGYIELGQPAPTLSGGEAQRVKLAKELSTRSHDHIVYLLDEPTTGLHFHDVQNLLNVLHKLVEQENTVIVIEHNMDIIKNADWIVDLGPEGGEYGGEVVATGTPQNLAAAHEGTRSFTGKFLQEEFEAMG